ncbi:hypothetical protein DFA_05903 [Cavenderia fasciculata]|uniref:Uncharacterized protein n=1 Tax=Cavenderia fasciculata TaxID=261658 RepID=F4PJJ4_CACFS|nr:uncharacterized protein DFA_05903 [Cavenderia fasciculata]EGG23768.1 hypothetical protein DFA_05903 [Cavenderia fasciculata]|eukprot:XP_004361619.1 hypothetical protein DFA_05903 [Cavenderia fasciculata]
MASPFNQPLIQHQQRMSISHLCHPSSHTPITLDSSHPHRYVEAIPREHFDFLKSRPCSVVLPSPFTTSNSPSWLGMNIDPNYEPKSNPTSAKPGCLQVSPQLKEWYFQSLWLAPTEYTNSLPMTDHSPSGFTRLPLPLHPGSLSDLPDPPPSKIRRYPPAPSPLLLELASSTPLLFPPAPSPLLLEPASSTPLLSPPSNARRYSPAPSPLLLEPASLTPLLSPPSSNVRRFPPAPSPLLLEPTSSTPLLFPPSNARRYSPAPSQLFLEPGFSSPIFLPTAPAPLLLEPMSLDVDEKSMATRSPSPTSQQDCQMIQIILEEPRKIVLNDYNVICTTNYY